MLSAGLNSQTAVLVFITIMDAFVKIRQFVMTNAEVISRMNVLEKRQMTTDTKVDAIYERLDTSETTVQGVFYDGPLGRKKVFAERTIVSAAKLILPMYCR